MLDSKVILDKIYSKLYMKDIDFSLNIFLCGADTSKKNSFRNMLNDEFKKDAKFNSVYPEYIFASLYGKGKYNLMQLEDDLAKYVDLIVLPLEGIGTYCELGAFAMNKSLLPKIIVINEQKYKRSTSFISLGPLDLIKKNNSKNLIYYKKGQESHIIPEIVEKVRSRRLSRRVSYDIENLFNLSRYILYLIAIFQPITIRTIKKLLTSLNKGNIKDKYVDSAIQILTQKNRIVLDIENRQLKTTYSLSEDGHDYVYEELISKLKVKKVFSRIRCEIITNRYKPKKRNMGKDKELLV
jgi:hypothetical protein